MTDLIQRHSILPLTAAMKIVCAVLLSALLSACNDESVLSGGAAGDTQENTRIQESITLLQPYVGVYQLQDGWMGDMGDLAYLSIRLTGNDGISEVALIDYDDANGCVPDRLSLGEVLKDPFSDRVFMNDIFQFADAVLSLTTDELTIDVTDVFDIDNNDNTSETVSITATRIGLSEVDLGDPC